MSMLLDLGLFLRENNVLKIDKKTGEKKILIISSAIRGFLFTLACRIGSDPYSWVSQETLAEEMDMTLDGIKRLSKKAADTGLIEIDKNKKDKRKNIYKCANFLINYHLKRREKLSTVEGFGIIFEPKKVDKNLPKKSRKVDKRLPSRCTNVYLISNENNEKQEIKQDVKETENYRKEHTTTIISKQPETSRKKRDLISDKFYPNYENQKLADQTANKCGVTGVYLQRKFIEVMKKYNVMDDDFDKRFEKFLLKQMPVGKKDGVKSGINQINAYL